MRRVLALPQIMLNDLYLRFDSLTLERAVYKVETIG